MPDLPQSAPPTMQALDVMPDDAFLAVLGDLFEHSPWVMGAVSIRRPFATARALHDAAMSVLREAGVERQTALLCAHPELAGPDALTPSSTSEQARLGFSRLGPAEQAEWTALNAGYRARFGFPAIVALCRHPSRDTVLEAIRARMGAEPEAERATSLAEVGHVTEARLAGRLGRSRGGLTLHVLDTVRGGGAPGLAFALSRLEAGGWRVLAQGCTTADGRTDRPVLSPLDMEPGQYRIDYHVGDYHRASGLVPAASTAFLEVVPVAFGVGDASVHYHVPLQFTPWSYATYRGS